MTLTRIYRWIRRIYALLVALAALSGIGPKAIPPVASTPPAVAPAPAPQTAPVPGAAAKKTIGSCSTASDGRQWIATCVVDGAQYTLPGVNASHALAVQAIQAFRAANR